MRGFVFGDMEDGNRSRADSVSKIDGSIIQEAVETLRGYILFLEGMEAKYRAGRNIRDLRKLRARRVIGTAFDDSVESPSEDS